MADAEVKHVRKRKKSFLRKQKQYGKKGRFGQGVELSEEMYQYFIRILEVVNRSKDCLEDLETLATNVLDEISGKEVDTCSNQLASRVVEAILDHAVDEKLVKISNVFGKELRLVFSDPYCSHVLQKTVVVLAKRILLQSHGKIDEKVLEEMKENFTRVSKFALNNLEDFIFDTYANHIIRTLFSCLSGNPVKSEDNKDFDLSSDSVGVPEEFQELMISFVDKACRWAQFNDLTNQILPSACLQSLVLSVRNQPKLSKKIVEKILDAVESYSNLDLSDEKNQPLLHLVESAIIVSSPELFSKIYEKLFKGHIKDLSLSKASNFAVQKIITHCHTKELFEELFEEVGKILSDIFNSNHTGILLALAKACRRLKTKQGDFSKALFSILNCNEPVERQSLTLPLICSMCKYENYNVEKSKVNLHGALIVQEMLQYTKPIRLVTSLLNMTVENLLVLLCDPRGCHITDAYATSSFIGEKSREKLFKKLEGKYGVLAKSKHGSRSLDAIWSFLTTKQKCAVMEELKSQQSAIVATPWGRAIASKMRLDLFRQDREGWFRVFSDGQNSEKKGKNKKQRNK